ncbi:thermonuclease family protein [Sphingorhabdus sp.]|jgi:endonuclease YncB( thermonuclease family)|uniref:thermonuclease family protein n=1 Tax=Sphingorhabdus sp. TaxID=1902408 RepID=UPI003BAEE684|nr:thermonuclease family protein [Sphingomonadales bacterium]MBK9431009.1 thermonuclease family protein [Sphingomonadales bacterium]MBL0021149.1 thermonuclease family protein [Sphingomonadales bacterium]
MLVAGWYYAQSADQRETVSASGQKILIADGDSFAFGSRKMRLDGIDAPEYRQLCTDEAGRDWECGKAARASLEKLMLEPDLQCEVEVHDKYARALATCRTAHTADVAAAQVSEGLAVSHEFNGMRDYGDQEDVARTARKGIWRGPFQRPEEWRAEHQR